MGVLLGTCLLESWHMLMTWCCWLPRNMLCVKCLDYVKIMLASMICCLVQVIPRALSAELVVGVRGQSCPPPSENGGLGRSPQKLSTFACVEDHWHCIFWHKGPSSYWQLALEKHCVNDLFWRHEWTNDDRMTGNCQIVNSIIMRPLLMKQVHSVNLFH